MLSRLEIYSKDDDFSRDLNIPQICQFVSLLFKGMSIKYFLGEMSWKFDFFSNISPEFNMKMFIEHISNYKLFHIEKENVQKFFEMTENQIFWAFELFDENLK